MSNYTGTPSLHHVFNELDRIGLLLGLPRLEAEANAPYKRRLLDVMVNRADSTYQGLLNGITRELGLEIKDAIKIIPSTNADGSFVLPEPAIIFLETKCYLYRDYSEGDLLSTIDRYDLDGDAFTLGELRDEINNTGYFTATILNSLDTDIRSMTIFNQRSHHIVPFEDITGAGIVINLENQNLASGSVVISSSNLTKRVDSQVEMTRRGDFYVDAQAGVIYSVAPPAPGDVVRYEYVDKEFIARSSPVLIHNLQSDDFKTNMFEQILDDDGNAVNGLPTALGADIINELLSAYPTSWGK